MTSLYRVVCGISQEKNEIYAAIHKAEKGLHQNMFWSLQMEHPEVKDMRQIGGSMYLDDLDSGPRFTIAAEVLKNSARFESPADRQSFAGFCSNESSRQRLLFADVSD